MRKPQKPTNEELIEHENHIREQEYIKLIIKTLSK